MLYQFFWDVVYSVLVFLPLTYMKIVYMQVVVVITYIIDVHFINAIFCMYSALGFLPFIFHLKLGFVHPPQDVALHQCPPLPSVCCSPVPGGSLLPCYVVRLAIFCMVVLFISSLSLVATLCSVWSTYCPSFLLYVRPISTFVSVCIL